MKNSASNFNARTKSKWKNNSRVERYGKCDNVEKFVIICGSSSDAFCMKSPEFQIYNSLSLSLSLSKTE